MPSPTTPVRRSAVALATAGLATCLAVGAAPAAFAAPVADVGVTAPATVDADATFDVAIDAAAAEDVYAFELEIAYDAALVAPAGDPVLPDGGFDDVQTTDGSVTVVHTRLGSSPALAGDLALAELAFDALAGGDAAIEVTGTLVGSDGEELAVDASTIVTIEAAAEPAPDPTTEPEPTDPADPAEPAPEETAAPGGSSGSDDTGDSDDDLAPTGGDLAWLAPAGIGLGVAALAAGSLLLLRRKAVRA